MAHWWVPSGTAVPFPESLGAFSFMDEQFWGRAARASSDSKESGRPFYVHQQNSFARQRNLPYNRAELGAHPSSEKHAAGSLGRKRYPSSQDRDKVPPYFTLEVLYQAQEFPPP